MGKYIKYIREHFLVILAFALPVFVIIGVVLSIYLPKQPPLTTYTFLYSHCNYYYACTGHYHISEDGDIYLKQKDEKGARHTSLLEDPMLFIYNPTTDTNTSITIEEAQNISLNKSTTSPDNVQLYYQRGNDSNIPFLLESVTGYGTRPGHGYFFQKDDMTQRVNLIMNVQRNGRGVNKYDYSFIGWIIE